MKNLNKLLNNFLSNKTWMLKKKQFSMQNKNSSGLKTSVLFQSTNKHDHKNYRPYKYKLFFVIFQFNFEKVFKILKFNFK